LETGDDAKRNPDVLAVAVGKVWGVACKVLHGKALQTLVERVLNGIDQIDASRADRGLVIVNMKNSLGYDKAWPRKDPEPGGSELAYVAHPDLPSAVGIIQAEANKLAERLITEGGGDAIGKRIECSKSIPGVALYFPVSSGIGGPKGPMPTYLRN